MVPFIRTYKLCTDTGYNLEDLSEAMDDRDEWRETERERESWKFVLAAHDDDNDGDLPNTAARARYDIRSILSSI